LQDAVGEDAPLKSNVLIDVNKSKPTPNVPHSVKLERPDGSCSPVSADRSGFVGSFRRVSAVSSWLTL
jgi:hypothetical protein